jgi:rare lipoprotein A
MSLPHRIFLIATAITVSPNFWTSDNPALAQTFDERWSMISKTQAEQSPQPNPETQSQLDSRAESSAAQASGAAPSRVGSPMPSGRRAIFGKASFSSYTTGTAASGAPYDRDAFTAAHRTLPFGTRVRVTDVMTNKSVDVVITDRGPAIGNRVLDLSLGAARALGITSRGVVQVRAELISEELAPGRVRRSDFTARE